MSQPNHFLIQRKALARFRKHIPFLALIPSAIYQSLSPLSWYESFGEIEQARRELEEQLDSYVMLYKHYGPETPWETQLFVYLHEARLTPEKQSMLRIASEVFLRLGIEAEAYQKPLRLRTRPLEHPFAHCDPPDEEEEPALPDGIVPDDISF
jgi:hypothetical protein